MYYKVFTHFVCIRYGDKSPKSVVARVFSIIWILLGLIIMAIFTANITSALTALSLQLEPSSLVGLKVGLPVLFLCVPKYNIALAWESVVREISTRYRSSQTLLFRLRLRTLSGMFVRDIGTGIFNITMPFHLMCFQLWPPQFQNGLEFSRNNERFSDWCREK